MKSEVLQVLQEGANRRIALSSADSVIAACERYKKSAGKYPDSLDLLVPKFLSRIPKAKYTLMYGAFDYFSISGRHMLSWTIFPPFGRRVYVLEEKRWFTWD